MVFNSSSVTRILDLDLDFFLNRTAYARAPDGPRLRREDYEPWATDRAVEFLAIACGLSGKLPGIVVEHHGELFERWRTASQTGTLNLPLSVTHVDAHADLGLGDVGYAYLMTEVLRPSSDPTVAMGRENVWFRGLCQDLGRNTFFMRLFFAGGLAERSGRKIGRAHV